MIGETFGCAILDTGCSKSVTSELWLEEYLTTLSEEELSKVKYEISNTFFRFGDGTLYESKKKVKFPARVAGVDFLVNADIIEAEIPLLLSKGAMKKAGVIIDLKKDEVIMFGKKVRVLVTNLGHYAVALNSKVYMGRMDTPVHRVFITNIEKLDELPKEEQRKVAMKWHKQFSHPHGDRLCNLMKDAGITSQEMLKTVKDIENECEICIKYGRKPPKPIVTLPRASSFNESVAMDLKFFGSLMVLHIIDHFTRYSAACVIPSKSRDIIIANVLKIWVSIFGTPLQLLCDMGKEFNNEDYREMGEKLNTTVKSTAAESPWSNGVNERHNGILGEMIMKTMEDSQCSLQVAVAWAVSAKNSLANVNGYSPNQLVFGRNPNYPCVLYDKIPALESSCSSKVLMDNLNALHSARESFIKAESSEKLRIALRKKTRNCSSKKFVIGDSVYYKKNDTLTWKGPGKVIGKDGSSVLVRHGAYVTAVPPCRLKLENSEFVSETDENSVNCDGTCEPAQDNNSTENVGSDDDDDEGDKDKLSNDSTQPDSNVIRNSSEEGIIEKDARDINTPSTIVRPKGNSLPKVKSTVLAKPNSEDGAWKRFQIISRGGKATGKYANYLNVLDTENDTTDCIDWGTISEWKQINEEILITEQYNKEDILAAKFEEMDKWREFDVYQEVENKGQKAISTRWVCTKKDDKTKARLVARGYEDNSSTEGTDSPTCDKSNLRVLFTVASSKKWRISFLDIQSAFLQGEKLTRVIYLHPPIEANTDALWLLKKPVYGLKIASRKWYNRILTELIKFGVTKSRYDPALFYWYENGEIKGVLAGHVDDFFWAGSDEFEAHIINKICETFRISTLLRDNFPFLGLQIRQSPEGITVDQYAYSNDLNYIDIHNQGDKNRILDANELSAFETVIGQLTWLANQTRPDISFETCQLSAAKKNATVKDLLYANKTIKKIKNSEVHLKFPCLENLGTAKIIVYSDASFNNLPKGGSQGAHMILLSDKNQQTAPIQWQSKRIKRVVKSTLAAECLALHDAVDNAFYLKNVVSELLKIDMEIHCFVDNNSLVDNVHSSTNVEDKRLVLDMNALKEMLEREELHSIRWVSGKRQISDVMTKSGASPLTLQQVLTTGKLCMDYGLW